MLDMDGPEFILGSKWKDKDDSEEFTVIRRFFNPSNLYLVEYKHGIRTYYYLPDYFRFERLPE